MAKPPYVPPLLHGRISREGLAALEPRIALAADFDARLVVPAPAATLDLDLGGVAVRFAADAPVAAHLRDYLGEWLVAAGAAPQVQVAVGTVARVPTDESVTRLVVREDGGYLRATQRGLMVRVDLERRELTALVEVSGLRQDLTNLIRVVLSLFAPAQSSVLFRATAVAHRGRVVLFSGPTLAGKTTVAHLSAGREVLSDDGLVVTVSDGAVIARSVGQWGGESRERRARRCELPLAAVFALRKAACNELKPLSRAAAAVELAAAVPLLSRDSALSRSVLELSARAARLVPVYELAFCNRDGSFWELVEKVL